MDQTVTVRAGDRYRQRMMRKTLFVTGAFVLLAVAICVDVGVGPGFFTPIEVLTALFSPGSVEPKLAIIVWDVRLPVAVMAVLIGAMLGVAGAQMQTILHNPLADPFTLGVSSAASFGAALAIALGIGLWPAGGTFFIAFNAFVFALGTSLVLFMFTRMRGVTVETFVLVGIALFFTFNALLAFIQYQSSEAQLQQIIFWMMGSLARASWTKIAICASLLLLLVPLCWARNSMMTALAMGDDRAASLGVPVQRLRLEMLASISLLAATATAFVGTIGFVGLVGPHIARMFVGEDQRYFIPVSAAAGAAILSVASTLSKAITPGVIYPIGIITALVGVPFFLSLVLSIRRETWR
ncbi:iron ABC transporter permease [Rhizobium sp. XQZ8]|uniref:FecCD family ABC transporter permease n=1 Tax=Rhizobium populisoli TaxID=2859785 RepID=UPI001C6855AA|nr:iron ABC transporter permease [Rhizobium populisoli]MBW6421486.1 iron ABC transporter permease [Rhizobium populisoli]